MRNIKLIISYKGTHFLGWQKTPYGPSIEGALEKALEPLLHTKPRLQAASRTDAGVHAKGQVVNFILNNPLIDLHKLHKGLNALLPQEISVLSLEEVESSFHPTIDNIGKEYRYFICHNSYQIPFYKDFSWHFPYRIDLTAMQGAAIQLEGHKNFAVFCNARAMFTRTTTCTIERIEIDRLDQQRICITLRGDRFLYKMVRNIVGTLAYIGAAKIPLSSLESILQGQKRMAAGITAPAHGLVLQNIFF
ncbi:MAG: tRNA pseudouridine(38-40) synthase TruA [Chlamydiia bacterium]